MRFFTDKLKQEFSTFPRPADTFTLFIDSRATKLDTHEDNLLKFY